MISDRFLRYPDDAAVIVTGAASGIGRATAMLAASVGLNVALWDLQGAAVQRLAGDLSDRFGVKAIHAEVDVTSTEGVRASLVEASGAVDHIHYLVNNAGP